MTVTAQSGDVVRAKRLGWRGDMDVNDIEEFDPYDYASDDLEGEYTPIVLNETGLVPTYTNHIVDGQVADPDTIEVLDAVARGEE